MLNILIITWFLVTWKRKKCPLEKTWGFLSYSFLILIFKHQPWDKLSKIKCTYWIVICRHRCRCKYFWNHQHNKNKKLVFHPPKFSLSSFNFSLLPSHFQAIIDLLLTVSLLYISLHFLEFYRNGNIWHVLSIC